MKKILIVLSLSLVVFHIQAQIEYSALLIPEALTKDASAVVRKDEQRLEILGDNKVEHTVTRVITVLNSSGRGKAYFKVFYDSDFNKLNDISVTLFDNTGKEIRKLKKSDLEDISLTGNDVDNHRAKVSTVSYSTYPYTVAYTYTNSYKSLFLFPDWYPQNSLNLSVQEARLTVVDPGNNLKYKGMYGLGEPVRTEQDGKKVYTWELRNLPAVKNEPYSPSEGLPVVYLSSITFQLDQYTGSNKDWAEFGRFIYSLNKDRDQIPAELATKVDAMTAGLATPEEKIRTLYKFLQENTRYVSVQLGIGGWQTFDAAYVYKNGYGDCKALSNYMKSMLRHVGIPSHWALIRAGEDAPYIVQDFPNNQFNHMILCVPVEKDTVWLECTSKMGTPGYMGDFTENRHALLVTPDGGKMVRTPAMDALENQRVRVGEAWLDPQGNAKVLVNMRNTGVSQDYLRYLSRMGSKTEQEEWLREKGIGLSSFEINKFTFTSEDLDKNPAMNLEYELAAKQVASLSGTRLFLKLNRLNRNITLPEALEVRQFPVENRYPALMVDSMIFHLPENLRIEAQPKFPLEINGDFGTYKANLVTQPDGTLIYTRSLQWNRFHKPAEAYEQLRSFIKEVNKADGQQLVLSSKT